MQTYLNELYYQADENRNKNMKNLTSLKKGKNIFNVNNKKSNNNIPQSKSSLFLNNYIRPNKNLINKKESNSIKVIKQRRKKKINVNPYQKMGNKYILNFALDNLNKYQENLLIKDNKEDEKNNINNNDFNNKIEYYNNFLLNNDTNNLIMNKSLKNNRPSNKNNIKKEKENETNLNNFYNNNNYSEYFVKNDLFMNEKELKNEEIPEPEPYIINKYNINKIENSKQINKNMNKTNKNNIDVKLNFTLSNLELNELKNVFEENYIFFEDLFLLTKEDFVEMKIPIGPRNRLINFIKKYKNYGKTFDLNELSSFMNKYKESINSNDDNKEETPSTNNKYKSTMTTENNKNKIIDDLNEIINKNNNEEENNNKRCNTYKTIESKNNYNDEENNEESENKIKNNDLNKNFFSNSLFNEFSSYNTDLKESNFDFDFFNSNNNKQNKIMKSNSLKTDCLNDLISKNHSPFITNNDIIPNNVNNNQNLICNKKNKVQNTYYKNYQNIFSEIEKYQINYEKMKKENDDRNNKINNLLLKKNKTNIQYLKLKLKNSKYYNDEDLKNESTRDLNKELQKMNFTNQESYQQNYAKMRDKKKEIKNPLIEEFNKHK